MLALILAAALAADRPEGGRDKTAYATLISAAVGVGVNDSWEPTFALRAQHLLGDRVSVGADVSWTDQHYPEKTSHAGALLVGYELGNGFEGPYGALRLGASQWDVDTSVNLSGVDVTWMPHDGYALDTGVALGTRRVYHPGVAVSVEVGLVGRPVREAWVPPTTVSGALVVSWAPSSHPPRAGYRKRPHGWLPEHYVLVGLGGLGVAALVTGGVVVATADWSGFCC